MNLDEYLRSKNFADFLFIGWYQSIFVGLKRNKKYT